MVFGDGGQTRDFVSVHDVAAANMLALTGTELPAPTLYTVATGQSTSLNDILRELEAATPHPLRKQYAPARAGDILHSAGSSARLQALGWSPQVSLREGIRELLA
jgi:UDP-glucose 4-epimerase